MNIRMTPAFQQRIPPTTPGHGFHLENAIPLPNGSRQQRMKEVVRAHGHEHVSAQHDSTFEVTTDDWLTPAGDCILAIEADRAPADFDSAFVEACQDADATITATIEVAGLYETITGRGDPDLTFESDRSMVGRTSDYVDDRTIMVEADEAASGVDREIVSMLEAGDDLKLTLEVE